MKKLCAEYKEKYSNLCVLEYEHEGDCRFKEDEMPNRAKAIAEHDTRTKQRTCVHQSFDTVLNLDTGDYHCSECNKKIDDITDPEIAADYIPFIVKINLPSEQLSPYAPGGMLDITTITGRYSGTYVVEGGIADYASTLEIADFLTGITNGTTDN